MTKKKTLALTAALLGMVLLLGGCGLMTAGTTATWTFEADALHRNESRLIEITVYDDGSPATFTLADDQKQEVTWKNKGWKFLGNYTIRILDSDGNEDTGTSSITKYQYDSLYTIVIRY